jgi:protein TonB
MIALLFATALQATAPLVPTGVPNWEILPSADDLKRVYPRRAMRARQSGLAVMRCQVTTTGHLQDCVVLSETPNGYFFGEAVLKLTPKFKLAPLKSDGTSVEGGRIDVPVRFGVE